MSLPVKLTSLSKGAVLSALVAAALVAAALLIGAQASRADTIDVFAVSGTLVDSTTLSGTFTIDVTTGVLTSETVSYLGHTFATLLEADAFFGGTNSGQTPKPVGFQVHTGTSAALLPRIDLLFQGTSIDSLIGYGGGSFCSVNAACGPDQQGFNWTSDYRAPDGTIIDLSSGKLKLVSSTSGVPEPSTLLMAGIGMLGIAALALKKS
jgi:hypothetical protein